MDSSSSSDVAGSLAVLIEPSHEDEAREMLRIFDGDVRRIPPSHRDTANRLLRSRDAQLKKIAAIRRSGRMTIGVYDAERQLKTYVVQLSQPAAVQRGKLARGDSCRRPRSRGSRTRRARSPDRESDEPAPAPAGRYTLKCKACGESFTAERPHAETCSGRCRQRRHVGLEEEDAALLRLGDAARGLVQTGELEPFEALALVVWPSEQILHAIGRDQVAA